MRATSLSRNFPGSWENFHKFVNFELIFEISSPRSLELKDLQLLCRFTTRYVRKFRDRMLYLRHSTYGMQPIQNIKIFRFFKKLTLNSEDPSGGKICICIRYPKKIGSKKGVLGPEWPLSGRFSN
jgi:hypothetical protein